MKQPGWVYEEHGLIVYRASSLGGCIASLVAARMGETAYPPSETLQAAMDASSEKEDAALKEYTARTGHTVIWQQKEVQMSSGNLLIRGHIDGLDQSRDEILEVKSLSKNNFVKYDTYGLDGLGQLGKKYAWQGAIYGHATGRKVRFVIYNKGAESDKDLMIIEPAVDPSMLVPKDEIWARVNEVENYADADMVPECDGGCTRYDAYGHVHIFPSVNVEQSGGEMEETLAEYAAVKQQIDALTSRKEELGKLLKASYAPGTHVTGRYTMNIAKVSSNRLDTAAVKKNYPDVYEACLVPTETLRLTVKAKGDAGDE